MTQMSDADYEKFREMVRDYGLIGMLKALARVCDHWATLYQEDEPLAARRWRRTEGTLKECANYLESQWEK